MTLPSAFRPLPLAGRRAPSAVTVAPAGKTRRLVLFLLLFTTYVSPPRLNVGVFDAPTTQVKTVDVRAEDILLAGVLAMWIVRPSFVRWRSRLKPLIFAYLTWSVIATVFAVAQGWINNPLRATFYTGKEIEYFIFFAVGLLCVRRVEDLSAGIAALVAGALIQGGFAVFQLATHNYFGSYAVGLLGDRNPHIAGLCGCLSLCLGMVLFDPTKPRLTALSIACAGLGAAAVLGSISRTAILAAVGGAFVLLLLELPQRRGILPRWAPIGLFGVMGLAAVVAYTLLTSAGEREAALASGRIDPMVGAAGGFATSVVEFDKSRVTPVYEDYWDLVRRSPILGNGKSITGQSEERFAETHNYYLRLIVETGVVGLLLYATMIVLVLRAAYRLYRLGHPRFVRRMGLLCLLFSVMLLAAAMAQDIFISPRVAELYWLVAGMTMSLDRMRCFARAPRPIPRYV